MSHELPNDLGLRILEIYEISVKSRYFIELLPSALSSSRNEILSVVAKILEPYLALSKNQLFLVILSSQISIKHFLLRIFSVNVTKAAGNCGFGHIS